MSKKDCEAQCKATPGTPTDLQGKYFRGLQINKDYDEGEWRAKFDETSVSISNPDGKVMRVRLLAWTCHSLTLTHVTSRELTSLDLT